LAENALAQDPPKANRLRQSIPRGLKPLGRIVSGVRIAGRSPADFSEN
jgi:hypothetical protein